MDFIGFTCDRCKRPFIDTIPAERFKRRRKVYQFCVGCSGDFDAFLKGDRLEKSRTLRVAESEKSANSRMHGSFILTNRSRKKEPATQSP